MSGGFLQFLQQMMVSLKLGSLPIYHVIVDPIQICICEVCDVTHYSVGLSNVLA